MIVYRHIRRLGYASALIAGVALSANSWAQSASACHMSLTYAPVPPPAAVPGLTMTGIGLLGAAFAVVAWRNRRRAGFSKLMAVTLMSGVALFSVLGGDSFVSTVRAAAPYELSHPPGGTLADALIAFSSPSPLVTVTNTSGIRQRIISNGNALETGTCTVGAELAAGATCTTQAVCPVPVAATAPTTNCSLDDRIGYYAKDNSTEVSYSNNWSAYAPVVESVPEFVPVISGVNTQLTYQRITDIPTYEVGFLTNSTDLASGTATITSTLPSGYFFSDTQTSTKQWTFPYYCWSQSSGET